MTNMNNINFSEYKMTILILKILKIILDSKTALNEKMEHG